MADEIVLIEADAEEIDEVINTLKNCDIPGHIADTNTPHQVTKAQIGLENVDNTSDADKPISAAVQTALDVLTERIAASRIDTAVYTKLSDYVDTLGSGVSVVLVPNGSALTDLPLNNANLIATATIFNINNAVIDIIPISSTSQSLRYSKNKSAGVWREWYKFTGEQVSSATSLTATEPGGEVR